MSNEASQLSLVHEKVQQLARLCSSLQKENISLKKELERKNLQLTTLEKDIEKLQLQLDVSNTGSRIWNEDDKKKLQKRIDIYIKDIEKSLRILNQ